MLIEKRVKLSEQSDCHHIAVIEKYKDSSIANLLDSDIKDLMFSGKAWKQGLTHDDLLKISLGVAGLECDLKSKCKKQWWLWQKNLDSDVDKSALDVIKFLVAGAKARRKELDELNSIFVEMLVKSNGGQ
tara:strand:+ start:284 stop:673 length:390 start_codon:yes stop_codon:yes gene_type:complete